MELVTTVCVQWVILATVVKEVGIEKNLSVCLLRSSIWNSVLYMTNLHT